MRFRIWGIQFTFLSSLPYLFAISNGIWIINIPRLLSITNMSSPDQAMALVFDKESPQLKLDIGWDRFEFVLRYRNINIKVLKPWVQWVLGELLSHASVDLGSKHTFVTKHGKLDVYLATGFSYYGRLPFIKFKRTDGYTYCLWYTDGTVSDRRQHVAIMSRVKCPDMDAAAAMITELVDITADIGAELESVLKQSAELLAQTKVTINKLE